MCYFLNSSLNSTEDNSAKVVHLVFPSISSDINALIIRFILSTSFIVSSRNKASNIKKFAKQNGLSIPLSWFVAAAEFAGALGLFLGVLSQFAALGLMLLMIGTIRLHIFKWKSPYWASMGGWEYDLMLFILASVVVIHSAGKFVILS